MSWLRIAPLALMLILVSTVDTALSAPQPPPDRGTEAGLPVTTAVSAVLMDGTGRILYEKEPHKRLPPASVTKAMTLLLAVEAVEQGRVKLADEVIASENAWRQGGSQIWLAPGEKMTVQELMTAIAVVSANDAAVALMEHIFGSEESAVEAMNRRATELGLKDTHFANVNGLPAANHYMSAYDTALIAREAVNHKLYMDLCGIKEYWLRNGKNWLVNTNKLLWWYQGADGLKTGWTEEAKYCFVGTAQRNGLRLISVVFATPEPRSHLRESMKLLDWGYANFAAVPIIEKGAVAGEIKVSRGIDAQVPLVAADTLNLVLPKGQSKNLQKKVIMLPETKAPVYAGQSYGQLVIMTKDGTEVGKVELVAERTVPKATLGILFRKTVSSFFGNVLWR